MELTNGGTLAARSEATVYYGREEDTLTATETLKLEFAGAEVLDTEVPADKQWEITTTVYIVESSV